MSDDGKSIVRRFIEEIDRSGSPPAALVTCDFRAHFPGSPNLTFDDYRSMTEGVYRVLEGLRHEIHDVIEEDDLVFYRSTNSGRHTGELMGAAPTGREVSVTSIAEFRMEDGRIAEVWVEMDSLGLMRQLNGETG